MSTPRLVFTPGEPAGVGLDVAIKIAQSKLDCELVYITDAKLLLERARILNHKIKLIDFDLSDVSRPDKAKEIKIINQEFVKTVPGKLDPENSKHVLSTIKTAANLCLDKKCDAMVTGPIHKGIINDAGFKFIGHTEYLQNLGGVKKVVMMLANSKMRVALATTHLPLNQVSQAITRDDLATTINILHNSLIKDFAIKKPKIIVAGLNPHAGEDGHLGDAEIKLISPVINACIEAGIDIVGPLSADTMFSEQNLKTADCFLGMYHDQVLPVLKYAGFGNSVNISLGLPFIRTSVDHGTALELAGTGKAKIDSLQEAINQALLIVRNHNADA